LPNSLPFIILYVLIFFIDLPVAVISYERVSLLFPEK